MYKKVAFKKAKKWMKGLSEKREDPQYIIDIESIWRIDRTHACAFDRNGSLSCLRMIDGSSDERVIQSMRICETIPRVGTSTREEV